MITGTNRAHVRAASIAVSLATFVLMLGTESRLAPVWDEGFTLLRLPRTRAWLRAMQDPAGAVLRWQFDGSGPPLQDAIPPPLPAALNTRAKLISPPVVTWFWPYAREEPHGHPPFYGIVALIGDLVAPSLDELGRARLGSMLFFSVTVGCLFDFLALRRGLSAASAGSHSTHTSSRSGIMPITMHCLPACGQILCWPSRLRLNHLRASARLG